MNQQFQSSDVTSDDRLWATLAYILTPLVPIIILLMEDKKNRPYLRAHNGQALVLGLAEVILSIILSILSFGILGCVFSIIVLAVNIYFGIRANKGEVFEIPLITNFVRQQGW
jgi:uncharacterized protein